MSRLDAMHDFTVLRNAAQGNVIMNTIQSQNQKRPIGLISIDTKTIFERLVKAEIGEIVPYDDLTQLIGRNIRHEAGYVLQSARRKAMRERNMVFSALRGTGVKRLSDSEVVATGEDSVSRIRRISRRGLQRITSVQDYASLPAPDKVKHNAYASVFGLIAHMTNASSIKKIEANVDKTQGALPLAKTLEAFSK